MVKNNKHYDDDDTFEEDFETEIDDEFSSDTQAEDQGKEPLFPFDKMPYQEKGENENDIHDYEMDSNQKLNLGESNGRLKKRNLGEERGAGHEP